MTDSPVGSDLEAALERVADIVKPLSGERLFITGGTGFVGTWLTELVAWVNRRLGLDIHMLLLTRDPKAFAARRPHLTQADTVGTVHGDVRDFEFPAGAFAAVIHGAASSDNRWTAQHASDAVETIVAGTARTLEFARMAGAGRFLLLSSGAVYGTHTSQGALQEDCQDAPAIAPSAASAYGEAKRVAEILTLLAGGADLDVVTARIFSAYGPFLPLAAHFAIGNFILDATLGRPVTVRGDGSPVRSYIYGADLAVGLVSCLMRGATRRAYNMGGTEAINLRELAHLVATSVAPPVGVQVLGGPGAADWYVPDASRAMSELGFYPAVRLEEGIRATIAWARTMNAGQADAGVRTGPDAG